MKSVNINKFHENLEALAELVVTHHEPLRVTRKNSADFIVMSLEDWNSEQETRYVLQNSNLMRQIRASQETHNQGKGYTPTQEML